MADIIARGIGKKNKDDIATLTSNLAEKANDLEQRGINITQPPFNLIPDGINDDTAKFQQAIDYLQSIGGGKLIIPKMPNPYTMIANNPTISNPKRVLIIGDNIHIEGVGKPVIQMKGMTKAYLDGISDQSSSGRDVFTVFSFTRSKNSSVKGIRFVGEWDGTGFFHYTSPRAKGVGFIGTTNCLAEDLEGDGILGNLVNATPSDVTYDGAYKPLSGIIVRNSNANKCLENGFNFMGNTFDGVFEGNKATYCGSTGFEGATNNLIVSNNRCSFNKAAGMSISASNYTVKGNILDTNTNNGESATAPAAGILLTAGIDGIILDNIIQNSEGVGLYSYPNLKKIKIKGNIFKDNGTKSDQTMNVNMTGSAANPITDIEFTDNLLENTLSNLLYISNFNYVKDSVIRGNTILSNVGLSMNIQGTCSNISVYNNKVNRTLSISGASLNSSGYNNQGQSPKLVEVTALPVNGTWTKGDRLINVSALSSGAIKEWRCTTTGTASNITWAATTAYTLNAIVNANNKIYQCTVAGTSGSTAPSHSSGTATDGAVTWTYVDALAKFDVAGQAGVLGSITSTPVFIGQIAVVSGIAYMATGVSSTADWKQITN